jgi:hypothetical protein
MEILAQFNLTESEILLISNACKKEAIDFGKSNHKSELSINESDFYLLSKIEDVIWKSDKSLEDKIATNFEVYELFPRYFQFLLPYYRILNKEPYREYEVTLNDSKTLQELKNIIWKKFMHYLGSEKYYADPLGYVLWVEFFEDEETANETWEGLMQFTKNKNAVKKLLEMSGPVAFELKEKLYDKIILDSDYHESIFKSLLFSSFDLFGKIDNKKALAILSKLTLKEETLYLDKLKNKLYEEQ